MSLLTYEQANDIEKILVDIETLVISMQNWFVYSGVSKSGQSRPWQNRFRHFYTYPYYSDVMVWSDFGDDTWGDLQGTWGDFQ